ncbi:MAG: MFS transporter [Hoeflea sp.]|uniref:MFS transporter n=1 Tax=Hoeflea sp. TaxID=1940281 RepID=UPI001D34B184|nr:MFS transporter [Hoeflea sp.]MBU4530430.1 MFS transporter [Alphaproteobacteria bacterium]MBU4545217.1 MFS transporter [Alphaproteobacteria bacterium]MBU4549583.1 MFS transporter [Alphaproteobacteria bacterium]MBV1722020.1 MFS transporter [Hoeflea sp.]MBV1761370.1 MFS transporter [Hoeflea sp.]
MDSHFEDPERPVWRDPRAVALLLAASLIIMANATISPALPGLEILFADDANAHLLVRLLVPAPSLAVVLAAPLAGIAADRFGRRPMMIAGLVLFVLSGPAGLFLPDLMWIFASRLVLGVAVAMIMTAQTALVGDYFSGRRRSALMGLQVSARNFGGMAFITLAGMLAALSPRLPFAIYALAIIYLPFVWMTVRDVPARAANAAAGEGAAVAVPVAPWVGPIIALAGLQMLTAMIFFLNPTQIPFFAAALGYDSASATGAYLGVLMLSGGCTALLYSRIKARLGDAGGYATGFAVMALGFALLPQGADFWLLLAGAALIGAGYAVVTPIFIAIALQLAPAHRRGLAGGIMATTMFLGQFASPFASIPAIAAAGFDLVFYGTATSLAGMAGLAAVATMRRRVLPGPCAASQ